MNAASNDRNEWNQAEHFLQTIQLNSLPIGMDIERIFVNACRIEAVIFIDRKLAHV